MNVDNSCDSPAIISTALHPLARAIARVVESEEDLAHPIDWDLLDQLGPDHVSGAIVF